MQLVNGVSCYFPVILTTARELADLQVSQPFCGESELVIPLPVRTRMSCVAIYTVHASLLQLGY